MSTVGLEIVVSVLFGFLGGRWLDGRFGTEPILALVGLVFGFATAARFIYRAAKRSQRALERDGFEENRTGRKARFELDQQERRR